VYAIIVNFNGWRDTVECLESVLRSDYPALTVMVCDNKSSDDSVARIRAWAQGTLAAAAASPALARLSAPPVPKPVDVRIVECPRNLGFAGANNVALQYMMERDPDAYALLFNNDAVMAPDAISAMVAQARRTESCGAVGATVLQYHRPDRVETLGGATISRATGLVKWVNAGVERNRPRPPSVSIDYVTGCCLLVPATTVASVGLMAEEYFLYGEDADWCIRMRRRGRSVDYCARAEIWHKGGASVVHRSAMHDYYAVRGTLMLMHRHFPWYLPFVLAYAVVRFILPKLVRGEWVRLRAAVRGYRDYLRFAMRRPREQTA
jgi:GT2 family glycosyltransferase